MVFIKKKIESNNTSANRTTFWNKVHRRIHKYSNFGSHKLLLQVQSLIFYTILELMFYIKRHRFQSKIPTRYSSPKMGTWKEKDYNKWMKFRHNRVQKQNLKEFRQNIHEILKHGLRKPNGCYIYIPHIRQELGILP